MTIPPSRPSFLAAVSLVIAVAPAYGQQPIVFHSVATLTIDPADVQPSLIQARVANRADFPALFVSRSGNNFCTSTLVGPRVMLTAAHCVSDGGQVEITHDGIARTAGCTQAPPYKAETDSTADWALCEFATAFGGIAFENINITPGRIAKDTELLLSGYGCTQSGVQDGQLRIGETWVIDVPRPKLTNNHIVTRRGAAVCFRDSGGPAFLFLDATKKQRVQVSVNSEGNISDTSYLSSLATDAAVEFIRGWSGVNPNRAICGLQAGATGCRP